MSPRLEQGIDPSRQPCAPHLNSRNLERVRGMIVSIVNRKFYNIGYEASVEFIDRMRVKELDFLH
jgi:hypothetical protein